ncbi:MAG: copper homeostasis protein CutC [Rhodoglobus sp.]
MQLEIAVQNPAGAVAARDGGADRIELCTALELGGLTPSAGLIDAAISAVGEAFPVHVLVRPRPGDFCFDPDELEVILEDIRRAVAAGAAGVVVGQLVRGPSGLSLDVDSLDRVIEAAAGIEVTFHRAFDLTEDRRLALELIIDRGVRRVLSSGHAADAHSGIADIERLVALAAGRIQIMAGGGVRVGELGSLARVGVDAIHLSAKRVIRQAEGFSLGSGVEDGIATWFETDAEIVKRAAAEVASLSRA